MLTVTAAGVLAPAGDIGVAEVAGFVCAAEAAEGATLVVTLL
jgi:hypothetical protein